MSVKNALLYYAKASKKAFGIRRNSGNGDEDDKSSTSTFFSQHQRQQNHHTSPQQQYASTTATKGNDYNYENSNSDRYESNDEEDGINDNYTKMYYQYGISDEEAIEDNEDEDAMLYGAEDEDEEAQGIDLYSTDSSSERDRPLATLDNHSLAIRAINNTRKRETPSSPVVYRNKRPKSDPPSSEGDPETDPKLTFKVIDPYANSNPRHQQQQRRNMGGGDPANSPMKKGQQQRPPKPTDVMAWKYVPLSKVIDKERDALLYETSCDELESDDSSEDESGMSSSLDYSSSSSSSSQASGVSNKNGHDHHQHRKKKQKRKQQILFGEEEEDTRENPKKRKNSHANNIDEERKKLYADIVNNVPVTNDVNAINNAKKKASRINESSGFVADEEDQDNNDSSLPHYKKRCKKKSKIDKYACFGCMWGSPKDDAINTSNMNRCIRILEENYGKMDNTVLARITHVFYKNEIYLPSKGKVPMWRSAAIKEHIEHHMLEPRIFIGESIKKLLSVLTVTQDCLFKQQMLFDGTIKDAVDERSSRFMISLFKQIIQLYRLNPKQMNFYNENSKINFERIGSMINLNKNWDISKR